jgi:adenosylcobalamin-dependent ribonucleoside-triphosphate reductase
MKEGVVTPWSTVGQINYRDLHPGMGQAVAERTILRKKEDGTLENWGDVAARVALGNSLLVKNNPEEQRLEFSLLNKHIANATLLMSGRHLQHGDENQPSRNMEVFTNCSTSASSFVQFYLLLNGSGVGRCYDDDMMLVDWDNAPAIRCVLSETHPDFDWSAHESVRDAKHKYGVGRDVKWFQVPDSREGWAKALELWENAAFEKIHKDKLLILDFSDVREKGKPIGGMQDRPASGPVPLMNAFMKSSSLRGAGLPRWLQAMYIDHYFAECVLVGGARRAARMATKWWRDPTIFDFIHVKRPIEFNGKSLDEVISYRENSGVPPMGFLWSSNNSVMVDEEFWYLLDLKRGTEEFMREDAVHARKVWKLLTQAAYGDGTGEPGIINAHKLTQKDDGWTDLNRGDFVESAKFKINEDTSIYLGRLAKKAKSKKYHTITNPCGEVALNILGGYCVIADVVPYHAETLDEAEEAFRVATRALIRVNTMDSLYKKEVARTNRIGVGITGIHEFAFKFFGLGFRDLVSVNPETGAVIKNGLVVATIDDIEYVDGWPKAKNNYAKPLEFWLTMARFNRAVYDESVLYSKHLGLKTPHTSTTVKPAGTTSKLFGLTEGWHLPALAWYMRWVQFRNDDPLVQQYRNNGYPTRELRQYEGTVIVGFPTEPTIASLGMGDKLVMAGDATPDEQYTWLMLGEKYWIHGTDKNGQPVAENYGNQISYTLKYKPELVEYKTFAESLRNHQSKVRCCSVMPQINLSAFEYQPEEAVTKVEFEKFSRAIATAMSEDIGFEHVDCGTGGCPIDFSRS